MASNWIVVAHRAGARVLATPTEADEGLLEHAAFTNETARLRNRELEEDRPGSARIGVSGGKYEQHEDAHFRRAKTFAKELADYLDGARTTNAFDELVLVAESKFLGLLLGELSRPTAAKVRKTITKDLHHVESRDIDAHLRGEWRTT